VHRGAAFVRCGAVLPHMPPSRQQSNFKVKLLKKYGSVDSGHPIAVGQLFSSTTLPYSTENIF
jgi:hypothetical protein